MYKTEYEQLKDKEWLVGRYVDECMTMRQIAEIVGCAYPALKRAMDHHGIERRKHTSKYPKLNDKEWLREAYVEQKMSGTEIAKIAGCPPSLVRSHLGYLGIEMRKRSERLGEKANRWKGGRPIFGGYAHRYMPDHPKATESRPYVQEHRLVMEKQLGRYLESYEIVHHKDGDRLNNDPDNLVVKTRGKHVSDHFKASHEVLKLREGGNSKQYYIRHCDGDGIVDAQDA
jgi:hypothetical protein